MSKSNTPFGYIKTSINQPVGILKYAIGVIAIAALVAFIFNTTQGSDKKDVENTFLLEDIRKTNEDHLKTIADLQKQIEQINKDAAKIKEELAQKQAQIDAKGVQIDAKEGSIGTLQNQLSELKNDKLKLHQIIDERGRELAQMTERNKEQNALLESTQTNFQKSQEQNRQDQLAIKNLQEELRGLNEKVNIAYNHEKELQGQVNKLLTDLNQTRTEFNQSRMDLSDAKAELRILKELHPMNNNMPVQQITVSQPQEESSANALKMVAIVSVIVMFIVFVVYMLRD